MWLLIVVLTVNVKYIRCENSTIKPNVANNSSCKLYNVTDPLHMKSSCGDNEIIYLFIKDSHLHSFPRVFEHFPELQSVDVSDAGIDHIDTTTFEAATHLLTLDMNGSNMTTLKSMLFSHANNLTSFDMANSSIVTVEKHAFQGLSNLRKLDLSYNKIVKLDAEIFQPLSRLDTLRLINNKVQVIDEGLFKHNANLRWVYFSHNEIIVVAPNSFIHCPLIELDLSWNQLRDVDLTTMKYLKTLYVTNNQLNALSVPPTVNELHAENNSIAVIDADERNELLRLFLGSNRFTNLQNLTNFVKLQFLDLSVNHFRTIAFGELKRLTQLKELKLCGNKLSQINIDDMVVTLPKLKIIELSTKHWSDAYVEKLQTELKNHSIELGQDRTVIDDDDDAPIVTTTRPSTVTDKTTIAPVIPTQTPGDVESRLNDIDRRLKELERRIADDKKTDDRLTVVEGKLTTSNAANSARFDQMLSTFKAYEALLIILFVSCMMFVLYNVIVYAKSYLSGMRYRRAQSHDPIFSEQDL